MKKEVIELVSENLNILQKNISDKEAYEHIIASILEIYTDKLPYNQVFEQITNDIKNINEEENSEIWGAVYFLTSAISCNDPVIQYFYEEEISNNKDAWERDLEGEVYNFIDQNG